MEVIYQQIVLYNYEIQQGLIRNKFMFHISKETKSIVFNEGLNYADILALKENEWEL